MISKEEKDRLIRNLSIKLEYTEQRVKVLLAAKKLLEDPESTEIELLMAMEVAK